MCRRAKTDQLCKVKTVVESAILALLWVIICTFGPIWVLRLSRRVPILWRILYSACEVLMRGSSFQLAALAREVASLKGRLSFLWNTERVRRGQHHLNGNGGTVVRPPDVIVNSGPACGLHNIVFVCTFFGGLITGWALSLCSVCVGVWIARTS